MKNEDNSNIGVMSQSTFNIQISNDYKIYK